MSSKLVQQYFRQDMLPHIWCGGCGNGILMRDLVCAIDRLGYPKDDVCIVSGIGCSSRASGYLDFNTIHTTHGRAIAVATGIKLAKPEMHVVVLTGDGDATAIGGNHFIHAARRNIGLTVLIFNNNIYGMTGGQYSPTTPTGDYGTTAPYGNIDQPFDIPRLAEAAGATFVARASAYHTSQAITLMQQALEHKGFSVIDCMSVCPTYYGRKNKKGMAVDMLKWQKDHAVFVSNETKLGELPKDALLLGVLFQGERAEYSENYRELIRKAARSGEE